MFLPEELQGKMRAAVQNNRLVGNARFTEEEYQLMLNFTRRSVLWRETDELNFVVLVEIAKRWRKGEGSDGDEIGFWEYVFSELNLYYDQQRYIDYTDMIRRMGRQKKIIIANTAKRYYATLMMHAFAPRKSIFAFLELIYNVYRHDLDFNYTEADVTICDLIYDSFCELILNMRNGEDSLSIGSASYNVKIGLRCLALAYDTKDVFIELVNSALLHIHSLYHKREILPGNYFEELLIDWWQKRDKDPLEHKIGSGTDPAVTKNTITVKFMRLDERVVLRIPPIRIKINDQSIITVSIYKGEDELPDFTEELKTKVGELICTSLQQEIDLNKILLNETFINFKIEISTPEEVIFSKKFDLEFILFGEKNEILSNVNRPDNYFVYAPFIEKLLVPADISTYAKNLYNIYPHDGEMLSGQKRSVFFLNAQENSKKEKITLLGNLHNCVWVINDKRYEVFSGHINLLVSNHDSINGFELFVNNKGILLSQLECIQAESQRVYDIGKLFDENIPYEIYLYSHVLQKELFRIKLVYFKDFNIKFNQNLFYGEDIKKLTILENGNVQELTWENHQDQIEVEIRNGKLIIDIPYLRWCIDDFEWNNAPLTGMVWYKDLFHNGSLLDVSVPYGNEDIQIFAMLANQIVEVKKNLNGKFEIGRCIFANEDKKLITFGIKMQHALQSVKLFEVATQEHFWDEPLIVRGDKIIFHLQNFIGSSSRIFKITLTKIGQEPICTSSDKLIDGIIPNIAEGIYWVNITSQSGGLFFKKEQVFWEGEFTFGDKDRLQLANMLYKISPLNGQALSDSWKMVVSGYYVSNLIRLDGRPDVYTAKLFYMTADKSKQLINNIEICQIEILSSIAMSILVKDAQGNFTQKLMCDRGGNLSLENFENRFPITITNYHFMEIKNV